MARIIKKYPNRRLYDTETSAYITLADVKQFVLDVQDFKVQDARSNEDLTRSILLQIILEEESGGVPMFSADMLSNIIRYYGHSMQGLMGNYLERSIGAFHEAQKKFQEQTKSLYGNIGAGAGAGAAAGAPIPPFAADALSKLMQATPGVVPNLMGDYLEKSASNVVAMQEELRKKAMQMFSTFPYNPLADDANVASKNDSATNAKPAPGPKAQTRKSGTSKSTKR
jgi:polyhydroxyalkanoate synthesis repressor PhaR